MPTLKEFSDIDLLYTMEDVLEKRIISALATNTTLNALLREAQPFGWTQGKPPIGKILDTPGGYLWIIREIPFINAQGSLMFNDYEVALRISLGNKVSNKPLKFNDDGTYKDWVDEEHTANREAKALRKAIRQILEVEGYDNNWYLDFVQQGVLGEPNRININYEEIGGVGDSPNLFVQYLTATFVVRCWSESSVEVAVGDVSVTVNDSGGVGLDGAVVTLLDKYGNIIWDASGDGQWITAGGGIASVDDAVAQNEVTVQVEDSNYGTLRDTSNTIPNGSTLSVTINYLTNDFQFTTAYANINSDPSWTLASGSGDSDTTAVNSLYMALSSEIYTAVTQDIDNEFSVAIKARWGNYTGVWTFMFGTDSSGNETTGTLRWRYNGSTDTHTIDEYNGSTWANSSNTSGIAGDNDVVTLTRRAGIRSLVGTGGTPIRSSPSYTTAGDYIDVATDATDALELDYITITPIT
jgi:hypothetical protein